jgi:hypothetical protein
VGPMKTKSRWIAEVTVSAIAFVAGLVLATRNDFTGIFLLAEAVLFAMAFLLAALLGGPGKVLALGVALGFGFAIFSAALFGEDYCEGSIICFSAGDIFLLVLLAALVLYPGWALGAGVGALRRLHTRRSELSSEEREELRRLRGTHG